jgi:hypothetical protein
MCLLQRVLGISKIGQYFSTKLGVLWRKNRGQMRTNAVKTLNDLKCATPIFWVMLYFHLTKGAEVPISEAGTPKKGMLRKKKP